MNEEKNRPFRNKHFALRFVLLKNMKMLVAAALAFTASLYAQAPGPKSVLGAVSAFHADSAEIEIKPETGDAVRVRISASTIVKKVAPGQTDLSKAEDIRVTDVALGDRVLVTLALDQKEARRIIVIPANDITKRDAADRADWLKRGVAGVVTAVSGNEVSVELRSLGGATKYTVTASPRTTFKRYASDSVRFSDAKPSKLEELSVGDQIRARGEKSADGMKVDADEVVFGTFLSRAGTISALNPATRELTIKDLANNKPVTVKFTADSVVKRMPDAAAMQGMLAGGRGGAAPSGPPPAGPVPAGAPSAGAPGRGPAAGRGPGGTRGPDIAQMLDLLPPIRFEDLKTGEIIVVSAIRGAKADQITAITFLANAETLVQLAMAARGAGATGPAPSLAGLASSISNVGP